jgi:hypothetical protein
METGIARAHGLSHAFLAMIRERRGADLKAWMAETIHRGIDELARFARGLQEDLAAVTAGLTLGWSHGPVDGQITRLKLLKRQGDGRTGFALLRQRVLQAASELRSMGDHDEDITYSRLPWCLLPRGAGFPRLYGEGHSSLSSLPSPVNARKGRSHPGSPHMTMSQEIVTRAPDRGAGGARGETGAPEGLRVARRQTRADRATTGVVASPLTRRGLVRRAVRRGGVARAGRRPRGAGALGVS